MSIRVIKGGLQAILQDRGRPGYQDWGVPVGGAMDDWSSRLANLLVGNDPGEAVLEITLQGMALLFESEHLIALTGAGSEVRMDGKVIPFGRAILVKPWSAIRFHPSSSGCRTYLSISGGFEIKAVMGSRSTYLPAAWGGFQGRALEAGDVLEIGARRNGLSEAIMRDLREHGHGSGIAHWSVAAIGAPDLSRRAVRFIKGPEWDWLSEDQQHRFSSQPFVITSRSNRMGYRLRGQPLSIIPSREMVSAAVTRGSVQLTHEGQPVLLMADAQTTGGYPRIAQVAAVDLPVCAQYRPGDRIRFIPVSFLEARQAYFDREAELLGIAKNIELNFNS